MQPPPSLEAILAQAEKRSRGFLPVPETLTAAVAAAGGHGAVAVGQAYPQRDEREAAPPSAVAPPMTPEQATEQAHTACMLRAAVISPWLQRVHRASQEATATSEHVGGLKAHVEALLQQTEEVRERSNAISGSAGTLIARKASLDRLLSAVDERLEHFTRVDALLQEASQPHLSASTPRFATMLEEMEDTAAFLATAHRYKSVQTYSARLSMAFQRGMTCLKDAIAGALNEAATATLTSPVYPALFLDPTRIPPLAAVKLSVDAAPGGSVLQPHHSPVLSAPAADTTPAVSMPRPATLAEALEAANEEFRRHAEPSAALFRLLEARGAVPETELFIADVFTAYADARARVISPVIADYNAEAVAGEATVVARAGQLVEQLLVTVQMERRLFDHLWDPAQLPEGSFDALVHDLSDAAYSAFRAQLLQVDHFEDLTSLAGAVTAHHARFSAPQLREAGVAADIAAAVASLVGPAVHRMLQDTQERIVFRAGLAIRDKVQAFPYTGEALFATCSAAVAQRLAAVQPRGESGSPAEVPAEFAELPAFEPMEAAVQLLAQLYPAVEKGVFAVFADEAVHAATQALLRAEGLLTRTGVAHTTAEVDAAKKAQLAQETPLWGRLYVVRQLLVLREALSPYDVNFAVEEKSISLSALAQRKLEIHRQSRESKRDVETELKVACEDAIGRMVAAATAPAVAAKPRVVECQSEPQLERLVRTALQESLAVGDRMSAIMAAFVTAAPTRRVLWRPVASHLQHAFKDVEAQAQASAAFATFVLPDDIGAALESL